MNYLALLGWSLDDRTTTVISPDELVRDFTLDRVGASPATFDYQKLEWLNGVYLRSMTADEYADRLDGLPARDRASRAMRDHPRGGSARPGEDRDARRVPAFAGFLFGPVEPDPRFSTAPGRSSSRPRVRSRRSSRWTAERIEPELRGSADRLGLKPRQALRPIRVAVTGSKVSPGLFESIELLGRDETLARLAATVASRPA